MKEITILGLSGKTKTLPPNSSKSQVVNAIVEVTDDQKLQKELQLLRAFTQGYLSALVTHNKAYEGFDEFYSYNDKWDINIHAVGEKPRTIYAVAYPQTVDSDGYLTTDTSNWIELGQYDMNGTPKQKVKPQ
jgi:hypothetical protein